jgi:hypothetical protein
MTASGDLDADGKPDLVLGDQAGAIKIISDYRNQTTQVSEVVFNPLLNNYNQQDLGGRIWPVVVNLFNANNPAVVVGNILGGLQVLKNDNEFVLSPNPILKNGILKIGLEENTELHIYTSTGSLIAGPITLEGNTTYNETISLAAGLYIFRFTGQKKSFSKKIVVR